MGLGFRIWGLRFRLQGSGLGGLYLSCLDFLPSLNLFKSGKVTDSPNTLKIRQADNEHFLYSSITCWRNTVTDAARNAITGRATWTCMGGYQPIISGSHITCDTPML